MSAGSKPCASSSTWTCAAASGLPERGAGSSASWTTAATRTSRSFSRTAAALREGALGRAPLPNRVIRIVGVRMGDGRRIAIVGAGPGALHGHPPEGRGLRALRNPRQGRRRRRHLAPQPLSRLRLRRPLAALLVLLRAEDRLVAPFRAAARDPDLPRAAPSARAAAALPARRRGRARRGTKRRHGGRSRSHPGGRRTRTSW